MIIVISYFHNGPNTRISKATMIRDVEKEDLWKCD